MKVELGDIMKVEDDLNIHLSETQREQVLNEYYERVGDFPNELWCDIVEDLIYEILN